MGSLSGYRTPSARAEKKKSTKHFNYENKERIAKYHGSQCGFCTPGIVMSMYTLLRNHPLPTQQQVETYFDGNLCRCTGYRPILDGFQTFTKEYQCSMGEACCKNKKTNNQENESLSPKFEDLKPYRPDQEPIFPPDLKVNHAYYHNRNIEFTNGHMCWFMPATLQELVELKSRLPHARIVVGNTEIGIETKFKNRKYDCLVSPSHVRELWSVEVNEEGIRLGAAVTLSQLNQELLALVQLEPEYKTRSFAAITEMLKWFASHQIRNVSSICGNIMTASPISDLNPLFLAAGVSLQVISAGRGRRTVRMDESFFLSYRQTAVKPDEVVISITIPFTTQRDYFLGFKQANRKEDDISLVNAGLRITLQANHNIVESAIFGFGGMGPVTVLAKKTMEGLIGRSWDEELIQKVTNLLSLDLSLDPEAPGGMVEYRLTLALSFFLKFFLFVKTSLGMDVKPEQMSAIQDIDHIKRSSIQVFGGTDSRHHTIGQPLHHRAALQHGSGQAQFLDDIPHSQDELFMYLVTSSKAHAKILDVDVTAALSSPGVVDYVSAADIPGANNLAIFMDTIFATDEVTSVGHIIGAIVADTHDNARTAARQVKVKYEPLKAIITMEEAIEHQSFHGKPVYLHHGDITKGFSQSDHVIEGHAHLNGQYHFYMEPIGCRVTSGEAGELEVVCSTQSVTDIQKLVANALAVPSNKVHVKTKRIGGGFGGKESQSILVAAPTAVAAVKLGRTVRCVLDRDDDMIITGNRHPMMAKYKVGFSSEGKILALKIDMFCNGGNSLDLSAAAFGRAIIDIRMKYKIPNLEQTARVCRTNITSNTAFRGFGAPQGNYMLENIIDDVAAYLKLDYKLVQEENFWGSGELTSYGIDAGGDEVKRCWDMLEEKCQYDLRRQLVNNYNRENMWKKRGLATFPLTYGISFVQTHMNQAGALVHIYLDGSVLIFHAGVEIGQGLHTKMIQVASEVLHIPHHHIHISETNTSTVPNTSPTAASVGTDINGMAVKDACQKLRSRIEPYIKKQPEATWAEWVKAAYLDRVSLSATGFYKTPGLGYDMDKNIGRPFYYNTYGAACSEVQIDCLTGHHTVLRTDIVMDIGQSINPAIDVGQIEGAFTQGYGLFMLEDIKITPDGVPLTRGPGNYKIPSFGDIPSQFNVYLVPDSPRPNTIFSSKGVGEPPLLCAMSIFMATKDAIRAARRDNRAGEKFALLSPATPERIRMACGDHISEQTKQTNVTKGKPWTVDL